MALQFGRYSAVWLTALLFLLPAAAQVPENQQDLAATCSAPGAMSQPECQAAKAALEKSVQTPPAGNITGQTPLVRTGTMPTGASQRAPVKTPEVTESRTLPPEPETEFQRFTASSIGQVLPIFGARLFENVPTTFAPVEQVPVTADYVIGPGDEILLRVWGQVTLNLALTVDRDGTVYIPQAGNVRVAGLSYGQLASHLQTELARVYRNFELSVNMGQLRSIQVFVVGNARRPGTYTVSSLSTLVNILFASGGPSAQGSMRQVQLKRGANLVTEFDLYDLLLKGDKTKDARLLPGDVIYIPGVGAQVAIAGSVKTPAIYELKGETSAGEAVQLAGGLSAIAEGRRALLERIKDRAVRETMDIVLDTPGLATSVRDGDILRIQTILPRFGNAVTLRGNVSSPGRFQWKAGMRLRDVIPNKESLVTRDYWKKQNIQGFTPPEEQVALDPELEMRRKPAQTKIDEGNMDINWAYALIERQSLRDLSAQLIQFDLGKLVLEGDETQNLELQPGDVVTIFSQNDLRVPVSQQNRRVRLEGEFKAAGVYAVRPGETLGSLIERAGGLTPDAYLYASEFMRESARLDQKRRLEQLTQEMEREIEESGARQAAGAASSQEAAAFAARLDNQRRLVQRMRALPVTGRIILNLEPGDNDVSKLKNLPLEDGDRFVVPARSVTVNVLGSVYNPNSFLHDPKLRMADYLEEAGGATRTADKGRIFLIRADGSVLPRHGGGGPFKKSYDATLLNPGDSVVVPEALSRVPFMTGLRDWTQVFSQLALGAAAINILR